MWWEIPFSLEVKNHVLYLGGSNTAKLASTYGTPLYVTNGQRIITKYQQLIQSLQPHLHRKIALHYSIKANSNLAILRLLKRVGSNVDATSPFEVLAAEKAGFTPNQIICTGTSFSDDDMLLVANKALMNIDSLSQLHRYADLVQTHGFDQNISIRINPGKGAGHSPDCVTAGEDAKYGVPELEALSAYHLALDLGLNPVGIHQHIGSGILPPDLDVFYENVLTLLNIAGKLKETYDITFQFVDFGGGLGIPYRASDIPIDLDDFGARVGALIETKAAENNLGDFDVFLEPGRFLVGDSTILITQVVDSNQKYVNELGVDAGFNVFDRPARYKTYHEIVNITKADQAATTMYRISWNLCESGDVFTESKHSLRKLPSTEEGDFLAILNAGAYGSSMSSNYNMRPRAREILIDDGKITIIRERDQFEDLIKNQRW
ncbi:MAG: diaminopimelate decarboxylase [Candidatus Bathyarchaeota archaeon]|nr:MAG: diaminopimelate decarboxylase [Candidatus Bathyarchaeota archaeon]